MAIVLLIQRSGEPMEACVGAVIATAPPQCAVAIEVRGVDWADVPWSMSEQGSRWAQVTLTGEYDNGVISAVAVSPVSAISSSDGVVNRTREQLCQTPSGSEPSVLPPDVDLNAVVSRENGHQGAWVSTTAGLTVFNIASVGDRERVERLIRASYSGLLCVGPVAGPTQGQMMGATERLQAHSEQIGLVSTSSWVNGDGARLQVHVVTAAPNVLQQVEQIVGPGVAPAIDLTAVFH